MAPLQYFHTRVEFWVGCFFFDEQGGFIEGYYGSPWSTKDRVNLMTWGGYYKMNTYVYAPKDDPLHRNNWRGLYTKDQIENEIKPIAARPHPFEYELYFGV